MTFKHPDQRAGTRRRTEFPLEGSGASAIEGPQVATIEGNGATIEGTATTSAEIDLALADTLPSSHVAQPREPETPGASTAKPTRAKASGNSRARRPNEAANKGTSHNEHADPEKVRLVAEINAVWRRLEEEEEKRTRLVEEVDELHASLAEEQRARSAAAREKRTAELREASSTRAMRKLQSERAGLEHELAELRGELTTQRRQGLARGAATASGLFGIAFVVGQALRRNHRGLKLWQ